MNFWRVRRCVVAGTGLAVLLAGFSVFAPGAMAQNPDNMRVMLDRMQRLERDIRTLNLQLSRGTPPPVLAPAQPPSAKALRPPSMSRPPPRSDTKSAIICS